MGISLLVRLLDQQQRQLAVRFYSTWYCAMSGVNVIGQDVQASFKQIHCESANIKVCQYSQICISSAISSNFLGVSVFQRAYWGEKPLCSWEVWGGAVSPPQWGPGAKPWNVFGYFAFWIAQNITLLALQQGTLTKAYTRNQHFSVFGGLSLGSQTDMPASK